MAAPKIDFSEFRRSTGEARRRAAAEIGKAAGSSGFVYLMNSGMPPGAVDGMLEASRTFFSQPEPHKLERKWNGEMPVMGYVPREKEALDESRPPDLKEAFNVPPPADDLDPEEVARIWPRHDEAFRAEAEGFGARCFDLAQEFLAAIALSLDLPEDWFQRGHVPEEQTLRLLHYFPAEQGAGGGRQLGAGDHSDHGTVTLLVQDGTGGLDFLDDDGEWKLLPPVEGAVLANAGDLLAWWTGGAVRSAPHRVRRTPGHRYSIAYFMVPRDDVVLRCPRTEVLPGTAETPPPTTAQEFLLLRSLRRTERFYQHHAAATMNAGELPKGLAQMRSLVAERLGLDEPGLDRRLAEFGHVDYRSAAGA